MALAIGMPQQSYSVIILVLAQRMFLLDLSYNINLPLFSRRSLIRTTLCSLIYFGHPFEINHLIIVSLQVANQSGDSK